jgi:hypothetical protein
MFILRFKILTWLFYIKTIKNTSQKGANNKIRNLFYCNYISEAIFFWNSGVKLAPVEDQL